MSPVSSSPPPSSSLLSSLHSYPAISSWLFPPSPTSATLPPSSFSLALALRSVVSSADDLLSHVSLIVPLHLLSDDYPLLLGFVFIFPRDHHHLPFATGRFAFDLSSKLLFVLSRPFDTSQVASLSAVSASTPSLRFSTGRVAHPPHTQTQAEKLSVQEEKHATAFKLSAFPGRRSRRAPKPAELPMSDISDGEEDGSHSRREWKPGMDGGGEMAMRRERVEGKRDDVALRDALDVVEKALTGRFVCATGGGLNDEKAGRVCAMVVAEEETVERRLQTCAAEAYYRDVVGEDRLVRGLDSSDDEQ